MYKGKSFHCAVRSQLPLDLDPDRVSAKNIENFLFELLVIAVEPILQVAVFGKVLNLSVDHTVDLVRVVGHVDLCVVGKVEVVLHPLFDLVVQMVVCEAVIADDPLDLLVEFLVLD